MQAVVFGCNGFLGKHVVAKFQSENIEVVSLSHETLDITQPIINFNDVNPDDIAINCAAKILLHDKINLQELHNVNVNGAINIALWAKSHNLKLIHCSTLSVYLKPWPLPLRESSPLVGLDLNLDPTGGYATSKLLGEIVVKWVKPDAMILRFSSLYGPGMKWEGVLPRFIDLALKDETLEPVENQFMDFLHVHDAASMIYEVALKHDLQHDLHGSIMNVASGVETSIVDLASMIMSLTGKGKVSRVESDKVNRACVMNKLNIAVIELQEGLNGLLQSNS